MNRSFKRFSRRRLSISESLFTIHYSLFTIHYSLFTSQVFVHIQGSTTAVTHSENHRSTTTHDVTTSEDLCTGRLHVVVDGNGVLATQLESLNRLGYEWVGGYTYGHNHLVDIECDGLALNGYRTATT